jgi:Tn3 transposase DDE domain
MLALHLLQISLVYINTLMIQQVLAEPTWQGRLTITDLRALTPLKWLHVTRTGPSPCTCTSVCHWPTRHKVSLANISLFARLGLCWQIRASCAGRIRWWTMRPTSKCPIRG